MTDQSQIFDLPLYVQKDDASPVAQRASGDRSPDALWATGDAKV